MCVGTKWIYIIVRFTDRMRIVIVCEVVSVLQFHLCETRRQKKKAEERDNSEFVTSNGHFLIISRYFIFFCSPVASPRRRVSWKLKIPSINLCIIILREIIFFFFSTFRIPCIGKIKFSFELNETNNNNKKELKIQGEFKSWLRRWGRCCVPTHALEIWFLLRV